MKKYIEPTAGGFCLGIAIYNPGWFWISFAVLAGILLAGIMVLSVVTLVAPLLAEAGFSLRSAR